MSTIVRSFQRNCPSKSPVAEQALCDMGNTHALCAAGSKTKLTRFTSKHIVTPVVVGGMEEDVGCSRYLPAEAYRVVPRDNIVIHA